ncbi:N,N'-diacetylchitobiose transport system substrate-binding protein [Streptacidiphilus sp. MAP12-16]|uniref:extracellular solute-binding protein n=1 Tax=Streptacidiphilus sp. MAP12-16 TaxID=3156300 RepID=UPI0035125FAC
MDRWRHVAAVGTAALLAGVAACSSGGPSTTSSPTSFEGKTLTVWLMAGDDPVDWSAAVKAQFELTYPGAKVVFKQQDWTGIQQKVTAALADLTPPDVIDIGNTQTSYYVATGGLLDLDPYRGRLGGANWTPSMNSSAIVGGKQYAAPWFAGSRVVMYNKRLWDRAKLSPPSTMAEWQSDLDVLKNTPGVSSALYLPGQNWYAFDGFLLDAGANILTQRNNQWVGNLDAPAALQAAALFKKLQSYGDAPKDKDESHPAQATVFAKGDVASMIAMGYEQAAVLQANPAMAKDIGWFPIPGAKPKSPARTFLGGSNLAVSQNSANRELALGFLQIALNDANETAFAKESGFLPNKAALYPALAGNAYAAAAQLAAANAGFTPSVARWGNVENPPNPIVSLFLTPILQGADPAAAAQAADDKLTSRLNEQ